MTISDSFYEDEVREGFYVPAAVKQAWGAELIVLSEIDRICKKHNIMYYAEWGTFLGAVRHGGFIPWDDDLDIGMKRQDFERFFEVAPSEFPEGFEIYNFRTHPNHTGFLSNVVGKARICFDQEHLEKFHGFPFITGIDIFILDYVSLDEEKEKLRVNMAKLIIKAADDIFDEKIKGKEIERTLLYVENKCHVKISRNLSKHGLRSFMYELAENYFKMIPEQEAEFMTRMMPNGLRENNKFLLKKEYLTDTIEMQFEEMKVPVFAAYDEVLRKHYGDFMALKKDNSGHGYPYFEGQKENLQKVMDFKFPGFHRVSMQHVIRNKEKSYSEYKDVVNKYLAILDDTIKKCTKTQLQDAAGSLQQCAIELGTYMEETRGEGFYQVSYLEKLCDYAYMIYEGKEVQNNLEAIKDIVLTLKNELAKKIVVFMPFKADYFDQMKVAYDYYQYNHDVQVVPISYYYKKFDSSLRDEQYDIDKYPEELNVTAYDKFDFERVHPDVIITQFPYDGYNECMGINPYFYSENIKYFTDELIYIPWFIVDEFNEHNAREYHNLNAYCTMPGVTYADKVYVQSENMQQVYIKRLTEFAGDDTKSIWENKVHNITELSSVLENKCDKLSEVRTGKRKLVYGLSLSMFVQYKDDYLQKMERVFDVFKCNESDIQILVVFEGFAEKYISENFEKLEKEYQKLIKKACLDIDSLEIKIISNVSEYQSIVEACDAYYGAAGRLAHLFRNNRKPVMIENVNV